MKSAKRRVNWVMVDYRCPFCDRPVVGEHGVAHRQRKPHPASCQHCKRGPFILVWDHDEPIPEMRAWSFDVPPKRRVQKAKRRRARPQRRRTA